MKLIGDDAAVTLLDGSEATYLSLDAAASTSAMPAVANCINEFLSSYSSVHRGAGHKSQRSTDAYEKARAAVLRFAGRNPSDSVAIFCRHTTDAINHLAYRLRLKKSDVVVTTVVEHHANLLPWMRVATPVHVECGVEGTFSAEDVDSILRSNPGAKLLAITGASNVSGWLPPLEEIIEMAHARGVPVLVDAAQLAPHRPLPSSADFLAFSGHKMYAPFGTGVLIGQGAAFETGDPLIHGGGAVELVDLDEVIWKSPPEREEAGSPNVVGAVAMHAAIDEIQRVGWDWIIEREMQLERQLRKGLESIAGVQVLGSIPEDQSLAVSTFQVDGQHHALVAARLAGEFGIGVRHGCFCAHPYIIRLLGLSDSQRARFREAVVRGDQRDIPGAVRVSAGISTTSADIDRFLDALLVVTSTTSRFDFSQDPATGDFCWT